jgi:hypothetical protein
MTSKELLKRHLVGATHRGVITTSQFMLPAQFMHSAMKLVTQRHNWMCHEKSFNLSSGLL